jgi:hypothetical protein
VSCGIVNVELQRLSSTAVVTFTSSSLAQLFATWPPDSMNASEVARGYGSDPVDVYIKWSQEIPFDSVASFTDFLIEWLDKELQD